jgi:hypothetical protein
VEGGRRTIELALIVASIHSLEITVRHPRCVHEVIL